MRFCCLLVPRTTGTNYSCLLPSLQILVCRITHRFRPEVLSTAMECYRFVVAIRGGYRWSLHRRKSKIFEDPFSAAQDLSKEIGVPLKFLRASWTKPIPRPKLERRFALHRVLWHKRKCGWFTRDKRKYYATAREAVRMIAVKTNRVRSVICPGPARHYEGVTWHKRNRAWICQHGNATVGTKFNTEYEAAAALSRHLKCSVDSLKRSHPSNYCRAGYAKRFKQVVRCYSMAEKQLAPLATLPGDLSHMLTNLPASFPPALSLTWVQFKYAPYRIVLENMAAPHTSKKCSAALLYRMLSLTAKALAKVPATKLRLWTANCSKSVARHHGAIPFMAAMEVIRVVPTGSAEARRKGVLSFGVEADPTSYILNEFKQCESNLKSWIAFAEAMTTQMVFSSCQPSLQEVCQRIERTMQVFRQMKLPPSYTTKDEAYHVRWLLRCCLLNTLSKKNALSNVLPKHASVAMMQKAFPDANSWLEYFATNKYSTAAALCKKLSYSRSSVFLTMDLCLICDDTVMSMPADTFNNASKVAKTIVEYHRKHGICPAPHVLGRNLEETLYRDVDSDCH